MNNRHPFREEYLPPHMQNQSHFNALPGGDQSRDFMLPHGAQFGSQPQAHLPHTQAQLYPPPGIPLGPAPGFHHMPHLPQRPHFPPIGPPPMLPQHYQQQHFHPGQGPPGFPPSAPPPYMMQPPMHSNNFPPLPQRPPQPTKNAPPEKKKGGKATKQKKKPLLEASPAAIEKDEEKLHTEFQNAKDAIAAMFPQLNENIQSTLLRLVLEDTILAKNHNEYKAVNYEIVLDALQEISSQPDTSPIRCHKTLTTLKEAYLDGKPLKTARIQIVSFLGNRLYREYPWLEKTSEKDVVPVAQELAMMLPAALNPLPLEPVLDLRHRKPENGWIEIDTAAVNAAQSKIKNAKLVHAPEILENFAVTSAARDLATACLQNLDTTCALLTDSINDAVSNGAGGVSELFLYGQTDFGVQTIINSTTDGTDRINSTISTNPSDLLNAMLTTGSTTTAPTSKNKKIKNKKNNDTNDAATEVANALEFRHLTLERSISFNQTSSSSSNLLELKNSSYSVWVLGGFAAPQLPSTLTTIDNARLFWSDRGTSVIQLDPGQHHTLTIALCRLNSSERRGESGILQQAVVLFIAVGEKTEAYAELARIQGASFVDVYSNYSSTKEENGGTDNKNPKKLIKNNELGMEEVDIDADFSSGFNSGFGNTARSAVLKGKGTRPVATLGSPLSPTEQPLFRIFACARRVSVALLDATQLTATTQLRVDAKPFIPPHWKRAFDKQPVTFYARFSESTKELLVVDAEDDRALISAASKKVWATQAHLNNSSTTSVAILHKQQQEEGYQAEEEVKDNNIVNYEFSHPILRRYHRLLHLEELAKEQDICRHDVYNTQLHIAVFAHTNKRKFTEVQLTHGGSTKSTLDDSAAGNNKISKGMYRGPSITHVFPEPLFRKNQVMYGNPRSNNDNDVYVLGMLRHSGVAEGRPSLVIGDAVHLRSVVRDDVEYVCLVASIDGDIVYLVMPEHFWEYTGLQNLLEECAVHLPAGGGSSNSKTAVLFDIENLPKECTFNGRVHVRFSFDRRPFVHMQNALCAADKKTSSTEMPMCFVPPQETDDRSNDIQRYLQPSIAKVEEISSKIELVCGRSGAPLNTEQRHAVSALVAGAGRASPYALHGPPGTGKTVTMVSAALQLLSTYPEARLLLCAPQNYSADLLCSALTAAGLTKSQVLRLNDPRRPPYSAKEDTMDFTLFNPESGLFELPQSLEQLQSYSVVVSTCTAAAMLYPYYNPLEIVNSTTNAGVEVVDNKYCGFTHVLIDESGQALLPEALIPLALLSPPATITQNMDNNNGNISSVSYEHPGWGALLCGDPQQLGPTVHSFAASASGLSSSLLERLISAHWQSSPRLLQQSLVPATSMLLANYRSHASLLNLPSKLFYRGQLVAAADPDSVLPPQWKEIEKNNDEEQGTNVENVEESEVENGEDNYVEEEEENYGDGSGAFENEDEEETSSASFSSASLMFYGVRGQQMRESDIPSFHNPLEAAAVADLVQGLLESVNAGVKISDIGIMATYRRQVQSIRLLLRQRGLGQVRVGTVDDYQGQEERIIFISTVLTKPSSLPQNVSSDAQYLGVWNNPKRFNVAITRAKALLVVVGHPAVLIEDPSWKELLRHCASIGAFRGAGADALAERLGVDLLGGGPGELDFMNSVYINGEENTNQAGQKGASSNKNEMAKAIDQMASLALLGVGDAAQMFPETLEEAYASYADEMEWRIML